MLGNITNIISDAQINIANLVNSSRDNYAYTMLDLDSEAPQSLLDDLSAIDGVIRVSVFE